MQAFQVAPGQIYKPEPLVRDPKYRKWITCFPCIACGQTWWIDPCHTGPHGHGQKASDHKCIPLCRKCHNEFDQAPAKFAAKHGLDISEWIGLFNHLWNLKQQGFSELTGKCVADTHLVRPGETPRLRRVSASFLGANTWALLRWRRK
jgi:hypothetical protein